jgi:hypothetical protein
MFFLNFFQKIKHKIASEKFTDHLWSHSCSIYRVF